MEKCMEKSIFASDKACYCATFGAMMARQVMDYMVAGRGAPTDDDMDLFAEEANAVSLEAMVRYRIAHEDPCALEHE